MLQNLPSPLETTAATGETPGGDTGRRSPRQKNAGASRPKVPNIRGGRALGWLDRLSVSQKLGLSGALFVLPVLLSISVGANSMNSLTVPISKNAHIVPMLNTVSGIQQSLDAFTEAAIQQQQGQANADKVRNAAQQVNTSIAALEAELASNYKPNPFSHVLEMRAELRKELPMAQFKSSWANFSKEAGSTDLYGIANNYVDLHENLRSMIQDMSKVSALEVGGGDSTLYYLKEATLEGGLLELRHNLMYANALAHGMSDPQYRASTLENLRNLLPLMQEQEKNIKEALNKATAGSSRVPESLLTQSDQLSKSVDMVVAALKQALQGKQAANLDELTQEALKQAQGMTTDTLSSLYKVSGNVLNNATLTGFGTLLLNFLLAGLATWLLVSLLRRVVSQLRYLTQGANQLSRGELNVQVPVQSQDEMGLLASTFNSAAEQLRQNAERTDQERQESAKLQQNISSFLDVTMDIAQGDLTKRGQVTDDVLGNVVDSINLMTDELSDILVQVQGAAQSVTHSSQAMLDTTSRIQQGTHMTADQAQQVAKRIQELTQAITSMALSAQQSAQTARQALLASEQGQTAVTDTLNGMQNIRREVQAIAKRMKSLGDRSLEIQEIVDTVTQITEQTHLLSVNASIEAAGAGEAGGRFGIVADAVRRLSTTSAEANTRISTLIRTVQNEVQDVIAGVEEGTREVELGYRVAGQAGERLREISSLTQQAAQLAEQVATTTETQASGVTQVDQAVQQIATVAQDSQQSVQQGRQAAEQLEKLAQQLNSSLSRFRLPGQAEV